MSESSPNSVPAFVCPFCGGATPDLPRCAQCHGPLDPLSRQATQNAMGPWFVRDEQQPHRPGCSYETILSMISRGKITADTILRGPSTSQFWYPAKRVPGVANHLGICHSCQAIVSDESECPRCGAVFHADPDRQFLGLMPIRPIPGAGVEAPRPAPEPVHTVPQPMSVAARGAIDTRLQTEIAALRTRTSFLAIACVLCAIIALGATWLLISGASGGGNAGNASTSAVLPSQPPEVTESPKTTPPAASGKGNTAPIERSSESAPVPPPTQSPRPQEAPSASPASPVSSERNDGQQTELAKIGSVRWP
ncbi:MAG: hypothetical protein U0570_07315 [Phycisphaerales bacterium]